MTLISIVTPFYNEERTIKAYFDELFLTFKKIPDVDYEIIAVDDGSRDATYKVLCSYARENKKIKVIKLSRNFGKEIALTAGLDFVCGDAIIPMDADLQDSPGAIPEMIKKWSLGYKVVLATRTNREDPFLKKLTASLFYKLSSKIMDIKIPQNVGDFRLVDKAVLQDIKNIKERNRFMRGIFSWVGYEAAVVNYERGGRKDGETKYSYKTMLKYALDGIFSFSNFPIRFITYSGVFLSLISFIYGFYTVILKIFFNEGVPGYASIMSVVLFLGGINFIFIGILGEYIGRIFTEVKARPLYIVEKLVNVSGE